MAKAAAVTVKKDESGTVMIPALKLQTITFTIVGLTPLIIHAFSQKAKQQMLDKQMGVAKQGRETKNPFRDFVESLYWLTPQPAFDYTKNRDVLMNEFYDAIDKGARFGFPSIGVKAAMVTACTSLASMTKVAARQAFHINAEFIEILGKPIMREDVVRIAMGTADLRYRPEFREWESIVDITYNTAVISDEQVANVLNTAGFAVGLGDYRPERDGNNGRFEVKSK